MSPAKCTAEAKSMGNIHLLEYVDARQHGSFTRCLKVETMNTDYTF
jgi:hypothetical protein